MLEKPKNLFHDKKNKFSQKGPFSLSAYALNDQRIQHGICHYFVP